MEKQNKSFKELKNWEKGVDQKGFMKHFSYEPTALVNKLLVQNTQGLRKSLNEIKQQKIKSNKDERNGTNNKNENDRLNTMVSVIDRINQFFKYKILAGKQPDELQLPKWVKISKKNLIG